MDGREGPPFSVRGLDHVLLIVEGMQRALGFYRGVLGCEVLAALPQFGMVELVAGAAGIDLVDVADPAGAWARPSVGGGRNLDHVCVAVSGCGAEDLRRHFAAHGVEIVEERREIDARGESFSVYVKDPSGNVVEVKTRVGGAA
jgi:glyoxylase I family protein